MRRVTTLLLIATIVSSCGVSTEEVATLPPSALFVSASESGFGPWPVAGNVPLWGDIDVFSDTQSQRLRGDIATGSGHIGRIVVPTIANVNWALKSPQYTYVVACAQMPVRDDYVGCNSQTPAPYGVTVAGGYLPFTPAAFIVGYTPPCPATPGMTTVHQCTGSYTPYDGSTMATAVVADGIPRPGLPYGSPLKISPAADPAGVQVECVVDLSAIGLGAQFTAPMGYTLGKRVVAVYSCP